MLNFFFKWFNTRLEKTKHEIRASKESIQPISSGRSEVDLDRRKSLNFCVYYASGGMIIEVRHFDKKTDEWMNELHIVTENQDLSDFLARIITINMLTR
jgi:hypothetical protein